MGILVPHTISVKKTIYCLIIISLDNDPGQCMCHMVLLFGKPWSLSLVYRRPWSLQYVNRSIKGRHWSPVLPSVTAKGSSGLCVFWFY